MQITHLCISVGVTDAPPNGVKPLLSTSVSDFLPDGVGEKIGRAEEQPYRPNMPPMGAGSVQACSGRWFAVNGSNFYIGATSFNPNITFVARANSNFYHPCGIVSITMLQKIVAITTITSLCLLVLLLNVTAPTTVGPFGILVVFILGYLSSLGVMTYFLYIGSRLVAHLSTAFTVKKPLSAMPFKVAYYYSTVIAAAPIMLIGLQSVGSIGLYEFILIILFVVIGCVYITKRIR